MSTTTEPTVEPTPEQTPSHQLPTGWTFWSQQITSGKKKSKGPTHLPLYTFNSIESFWELYNSLRIPSEMQTRIDLIFMRAEPNLTTSTTTQRQWISIQPEWEDVNNCEGGEYRFNIDKELQDKQWETTLVSILGGSMPFSEEISGIWLGANRKSGTTLSLWKKSPDDKTPEESIEKVFQAWKKVLLDAGAPITEECIYIPHKVAIDAASSNQAATPSVKWPADNTAAKTE